MFFLDLDDKHVFFSVSHLEYIELGKILSLIKLEKDKNENFRLIGQANLNYLDGLIDLFNIVDKSGEEILLSFSIYQVYLIFDILVDLRAIEENFNLLNEDKKISKYVFDDLLKECLPALKSARRRMESSILKKAIDERFSILREDILKSSVAYHMHIDKGKIRKACMIQLEGSVFMILIGNLPDPSQADYCGIKSILKFDEINKVESKYMLISILGLIRLSAYLLEAIENINNNKISQDFNRYTFQLFSPKNLDSLDIKISQSDYYVESINNLERNIKISFPNNDPKIRLDEDSNYSDFNNIFTIQSKVSVEELLAFVKSIREYLDINYQIRSHS